MREHEGEFFDRTLDENYDRVARGLHLKPRSRALGSRGLPSLAAFFVVGGVLSTFVDPTTTLGPTFVLLSAAMTIGLVLVAFGFDLPALVFARRRVGGTISAQARVGALGAAVACVALSRITKVQAAYLYGLLAGLAFTPALERRRDGQVNAIAAVVTLLVALGAFLLCGPAARWAGGEHPSAIAMLCETILAVVYAAGIETAMFGMLPIEFLRGKKVFAWTRAVWAVVFGLAVFTFVHVELQPAAKGSPGPSRLATALFLGFAVLSLVLWVVFRYVVGPEREPAAAPPARAADPEARTRELQKLGTM
jgi:hypothetical protein